MSMKALRSQSKAGAASRLARIGRFAKGGKVADDDTDDKPTMKAKKSAAPMMVDGKPARARLDRPGRRMKRAAGGGTSDMRSDDDDSPVEQAGWLDKGASIASRLIRGGAKPAAKAIEDSAASQRLRDMMNNGKSFSEAHRETYPELYKGRDRLKRAVDEWKARTPEDRKTGGKVK